jgi:hypothetical protein
MIRPDCPGAGQPAVHLEKYKTAGACPGCHLIIGVDFAGRMRPHKVPSERQIARRREYLEHKSARELTHAGGV